MRRARGVADTRARFVYGVPVLRRIDPLGPVFAMLGLGVFLLRGFNGTLTRDLALYAYSGQQFAHGVPPYVGVMNRAGPLAHIVPGIGATVARVLGTDDVTTQRVLSTILSMATVWLVYLVGRDLYRSRAAGAIAAASLLTIRVFMLFATSGTREKTVMMLMVTIALWAILHRRWGWAGFFVSLATLTWQPAFLMAAATALAAMGGLRGRDLGRSLVRFCVGGAIPAVVAVLAFAAVGAFRPLLNGFLLINLHYTRQIGLLQFVRHKDSLLDGGYGASLLVILVGLAAALVTAVVLWLRAEDRNDPSTRAQIALGLGVVAALLTSLKTINGWPDALFAVPIAVLGFAGLLHRVITRLPAPRVVSAVVCAVAVVLAALSAGSVNGGALPAQRATVKAVFDVAGPDATIASIGAPAPLVLAHKTNPVRYQMFTHGFDDYIDATYPGGLRGLARRLDRLQLTFLTVDNGGKYAWIKPTLARHYVLIGGMADVNWYARADLDPQELDRLRQAVEGFALARSR